MFLMKIRGVINGVKEKCYIISTPDLNNLYNKRPELVVRCQFGTGLSHMDYYVKHIIVTVLKNSIKEKSTCMLNTSSHRTESMKLSVVSF